MSRSRSRRVAVATLVSAALVAAGVLVGVPPGGGSSPAQAYTTPGARLGFSEGWSIMWEPDAEQTQHFDAMAATGARWIRLDFDWASANPSPGTYNWATIDRAVAKAHARGMSVIALAAYTPAWARPGGTTDKHPPTDPNTYATFVRAASARYAPQGVKAWEIWNEANSHLFWAPKPNVAAYATLLKLAHSAIKSQDPSATVLTAGTSPAADTPDGSYVSPLTFLKRLYANGAGGSFDAVGHHPYNFPYSPLGTETWSAFHQTVTLRNTMVAQGDGAKQIWATEFGAPTGTSSQAVSEAAQALQVSEAIGRWNAWAFTGPLLWYSYRDAGTDPANREDNFGLVRRDWAPKAALAAFTRVTGTTPPTPPSGPAQLTPSPTLTPVAPVAPVAPATAPPSPPPLLPVPELPLAPIPLLPPLLTAPPLSSPGSITSDPTPPPPIPRNVAEAPPADATSPDAWMIGLFILAEEADQDRAARVARLREEADVVRQESEDEKRARVASLAAELEMSLDDAADRYARSRQGSGATQ